MTFLCSTLKNGSYSAGTEFDRSPTKCIECIHKLYLVIFAMSVYFNAEILAIGRAAVIKFAI